MAIYRGSGGSGDATTDSTQEAIAAVNAAANAAASAVSASASADSAADSASSASESVTLAGISASAASTYATNAQQAYSDTAALYDSFDDRYLGSKSSAPILDNDGNALVEGVLYWNSTSNGLYIYNGSTWQATTAEATPIALNDLTDVTITSPVSGNTLSYNGTSWVNTTGGNGTVTSVAASVPVGFTISGSPITASGTLAISYDTGYALPTTTKQTQWDNAYSWGNHASAGYATTSAVASGYQPLDGDLTSIAGLAGTSGFLKKTGTNAWSLDTNTYLTSYTETDPVFVAHAAYNVTNTKISNWDTAYGWGNHASAGYLTTLNLDGLTDVAIAAPTTGDIIKFNGTTWANVADTGSSTGGLGVLTAYNYDGTRDDIAVDAVGNVTELTVSASMILGADLDIYQNSLGNYGWRDLREQFNVRGSGANSPSWGSIGLGNMEGYLWSASVMNQCWIDFHIDHDYAMGTVLYPHVHWLPTTTGTGTVRWGFEYTVAKGHQQSSGSVFGASTTVYVEQNIATASQFKHFVAEVSLADAIPSTNIEPDAVIKVRVFRDAAHANDTYTGTVNAWQGDLHYQTGRFATLNKAPNFFA